MKTRGQDIGPFIDARRVERRRIFRAHPRVERVVKQQWIRYDPDPAVMIARAARTVRKWQPLYIELILLNGDESKVRISFGTNVAGVETSVCLHLADHERLMYLTFLSLRYGATYIAHAGCPFPAVAAGDGGEELPVPRISELALMAATGGVQ